MKYLLDTDTCIYWLNGRTSVRDRLLAVGWTEIAICVITVAELYFGAYNSSKIVENLACAERFIQEIPVLPLNINALRRYGELKAQLRKIGRPIANFDLLIASVALTENLILVTNNTRHYNRLSGLTLENWAN
ncbi:MAG: type II toxin-antitoxin system VapC family toxin [Xenococcaceae cyanobacterium]